MVQEILVKSAPTHGSIQGGGEGTLPCPTQVSNTAEAAPSLPQTTKPTTTTTTTTTTTILKGAQKKRGLLSY